jgi:hypothetical protein
MTSPAHPWMALCGHESIHNAIGRWLYQAKKEEEEEQINVVLFVTKN